MLFVIGYDDPMFGNRGPLTIRMNSGEVVTRPYAEAVRLMSRRMADLVQVADESADPSGTVPLDAPATDETTATGPGADPAYTDLTKVELVAYAEARNLPTYGTKADIIERLEDDDRLSHTDADGAGVATPENVPEETKASTSDGRD